MLPGMIGAPGGGSLGIDYIFSSDIWTGDGTSETISNGIDLSGLGGVVIIRRRDAAGACMLFDTVRGATKYVATTGTSSETTDANSLTAFTSTGYTLGSASAVNANTGTFVGWTFARQAGFFDVQTYTGDGAAGGQAVSHDLGSTPGLVIVKAVSTTGAGRMWHRTQSGESVGTNVATQFITTNIETYFGDNTVYVAPDSTTLQVGSALNASGETYVAFIFGHGDLIDCGSYTGNGATAGPSVNTGSFQPQFLWFKGAANTSRNAFVLDIVRGWTAGDDPMSATSSSVAGESLGNDISDPTATGFDIVDTIAANDTSGEEYVFMAVKAP